jgi:hypothetical protein
MHQTRLHFDFVIRENPRIYALIERSPWVLATPPVPPGLGLGTSTPVAHGPGEPPVVFRP